MLLLIDNYDSFTYNLARYFREMDCAPHVVRNDAAAVDELMCEPPDAVVISPGPCAPRQAGICLELLRRLPPNVPVLGVCLGHQAIAESLGASITRGSEPFHGRTSIVEHSATRLFDGIPRRFRATRYHSLIVDESTLPAEFAVTARTEDGLLMAIEHAERPLFGVQFHPESVLTQDGHRLLSNFLCIAGIPHRLVTLQEVESPLGEPTQTYTIDGQALHW